MSHSCWLCVIDLLDGCHIIRIKETMTKKKREGLLKIKWWDYEKSIVAIFKWERNKFNDSLTIKKR